jgi:uncharacterized Zn-finger protein
MASQTDKTPSAMAEGPWYMNSPELVVVTTKKIACDGGGGALGHPKVWYDMFEQDYVECKYCDRVYALKGGSRDPQK